MRIELRPRRVGSNAEPFVIELTDGGVAASITSCTCALRSAPLLGASAAVVWGPVAGTVPQAGVAFYQPSVPDVTVTPGTYEYQMSCLLADGTTWVSPWIRHEIR